jgi:demethylmenaquinone methyltransferase / 2-methoxy-6-polyprenyl-1,4-benzoquinol methylase
MKEQVTPYKTSDSKKEQVQSMFDNIAPKYDLLNRILSLGVDVWWRKQAVKHLRAYQPDHVVDIACGTGDFSIAVYKSGVAKVTGVDIANEMLVNGRVKLKEMGLDKGITLVQGDSEQLQFDDNTFDGATVAFGVRNFEHLEKGLTEILRVLRPGAPLIVLEFSKPRVFPVKQLFNFYFKTICPMVGRLVSGDARAYTYLYESVQVFPDGTAFTSIMETCGYKSIQWKKFTFGICSMYIGVK